MAKIENLFESGRGKLGNLVFYKVGNNGYVRTQAAHFRDRKSPAQLAQRQKLQLMSGFLKPFTKLIRITFSADAMGRSPMRAALSYNMRQALAGEYPGIYVDKSKVLLSHGPLPVPVTASVASQPDGLHITWENGAEAARLNSDDILVVMALSADTRSVDFLFTGVRRSVGHYLWSPALQKNNSNQPDIWLAFRNRQETMMSNSFYVSNGEEG